ncbi:MAG: hypothetical protein ACOX3A_05335 [bacterium]|jgi:hypothetical protein
MRAKEAVFLLGFLCGCLIMNLFLAAKLDTLYAEIESLATALAERESLLERLQEASANSSSPIIKEIKPEIILKGNRPLQIELEKRVREWLDIFLGRDLSSLDPAAIPFIIDGRIETINGRKVRLEVETTVVSEQLIIFIRPHWENQNEG